MTDFDKKIIVWERTNKSGKWCPYSAEISNFLELSRRNDVPNVCLGAINEELKIFSVNLKDMLQVSETTGTKLSVRRKLYDGLSAFGRGFSWEWHDDSGWIPFDSDVNDYIDTAFLEGKKSISLGRKFPGYPYEIVFTKMLQINKKSKRKRKVRRAEITSYPIATASDLVDVDVRSSAPPMDFEINCSAPPMEIDINNSAPPAAWPTMPCALRPEYLAQEIPGTSDLLSQVNAYKRSVETAETVEQMLNYKRMNVSGSENGQNIGYTGEKQGNNFNLQQSASEPLTTVALVNGRPWTDSRPPHTPHSKLKPVPGIEPLPSCERPKKHRRKGAVNVFVNETVNVLEKYTEIVELSPEMSNETCIICCESLSDGSSYNDDKTIVKLTLCSHVFHKACIEAMFDSGNKEFLQCPSCKCIHGEKCGMQPPGEMIYHVIPYSLPGYPENETIRIIYDIHSGIQGPEHPQPGKRYSARGFPRHCYLPDNEIGRKILRLLIKAWKRRLIFTIGRSSTTGEENTVTWNEIHHKTEFGCNRRGHGYPDPNYFSNVLAELEAHGVVDDEVRVWVPV